LKSMDFNIPFIIPSVELVSQVYISYYTILFDCCY
jgi:hypothetical protein